MTAGFPFDRDIEQHQPDAESHFTEAPGHQLRPEYLGQPQAAPAEDVTPAMIEAGVQAVRALLTDTLGDAAGTYDPAALIGWVAARADTNRRAAALVFLQPLGSVLGWDATELRALTCPAGVPASADADVSAAGGTELEREVLVMVPTPQIGAFVAANAAWIQAPTPDQWNPTEPGLEAQEFSLRIPVEHLNRFRAAYDDWIER